MKPPRKCRRGHALKGTNVRKQVNRTTRADGKAVKTVTRVCKACCAYRAKRRAAGLVVKDLRRGAR